MSDEKAEAKPEVIESLTPEQEAQIPMYRDRWIKIGLSTHRVLKEEAEPALKKFGELVLGRVPTEVIVCPSPVAAWDKVLDVTGVDKKTPFVWPYLDGCFSAGYFAFYSFCKEVLKIPLSDKYDSYEALTRFSLVYPLDNGIWILSDHPTCIHMKAGVLHRDGGPAVEYSDGFAVYSLNGVRVDKDLACLPSGKLDPAGFSKIDNAEVRREFVRKVGVERIVQATGATCVDKQGDYELLMVDLKGQTGRWPYLKMKNPSIGVWHLEAVGQECKTVAEALKFRNKDEGEPVVLT